MAQGFSPANDADGVPGTTFKAGDLIKVTLTLEIPKERRWVALVDPIPSGFEPVESWFQTTAADLAKKQRDEDEGSSREWRSWWERGGFDHVERHDDRVMLFATRLAEGRHDSPPSSGRRGGDVQDGAGARRGDMRAGSVWTDFDRHC